LAVDDEEYVASGVGSGPVDAAVTATRDALDIDATLESYHVDAITGGTDALVTVEVEVSYGDMAVSMSASDADITRASVIAVLNAFNWLLDEGDRLRKPNVDR
jgi:D-citramalate synthase